MLPHVGVGGWTPNPRNDSEDSARMAAATARVTTTVIGPRQFGRTWDMIILRFEDPDALAASTNSFSFSDSTTPRTIRAFGIQKNRVRMATTPMMVFRWGNDRAMMVVPRMATTRNGMARNRSVTRIRSWSTHLP